MDIHRSLRKSVQNQPAKTCADLHGINRIGFSGSSCINLKGSGKLRIPCLHIAYNIFSHLLKALILIDHNRTDSHNTKNSLQRFYCLVKIIFLRAEHINTALLLDHTEISFHRFQSKTHLFYQSILKKIPVFAFNGDFRILNQKCMKYHKCSPFCIFYLLEYLLSMGTSSPIT